MFSSASICLLAGSHKHYFDLQKIRCKDGTWTVEENPSHFGGNPGHVMSGLVRGGGYGYS